MSDLPPEEKELLPPENTPLPGPDKFPPLEEFKEEKPKGFISGCLLSLPWTIFVVFMMARMNFGFNDFIFILFGIPILFAISPSLRPFARGMVIGQITIIILFFMILYALCGSGRGF